jgi:hypothetical protein
MQRLLSFAVLLSALVLLNGCTSQSTASKEAAPAAGGPDIVGKWKGELKIPEASKDDPGAKLAEAMSSMMLGSLTLEFMPGDKFKLSMMGIPVEGTVKRNGLEMTLHPERAMGVDAEEMKKQNANFSGEDIQATISADGTKITLKGKDDKPEEGEMVFVRAKEEPKKASEATVKDAEKSWVGSYAAQMEGSRPAKMTEKEEEEWKMAEAVLQSASLELFSDNTFALMMMLEMEGTWSVEGQKLRLKMTKMAGMPDGGKTTSNGKDDMILQMSADGKKLTLNEPGPGGAKLAFVKK